VVATHRHQDHISGFGELELWKQIKVEEVWLPFTMNPGIADPALRAWGALIEGVESLLQGDELGQATKDSLAAHGSRDLDEVRFILWNARSNKPGIQNLLSGMTTPRGGAAKRRFLPESDQFPFRFTSPVLPGIFVHVLGPPRNPELRKAHKVPPSWGIGGRQPFAPAPSPPAGSPFGEEWQVPWDKLPGQPPMTARTLKSIAQFNEDLLYSARALEGFSTERA
jgi:hypothetical protein